MKWPRWLRQGKDRRRSPRVKSESLAAIYWEGSSNSSHAIYEVSLDGALIQTPVEWAAGTMIRMNVRLSPHDDDAEEQAVFSGVWCRVARSAPGVMGVEFLFFRPNQRREFKHFLERINLVRPEREKGKVKQILLRWAGID